MMSRIHLACMNLSRLLRAPFHEMFVFSCSSVHSKRGRRSSYAAGGHEKLCLAQLDNGILLPFCDLALHALLASLQHTAPRTT